MRALARSDAARRTLERQAELPPGGAGGPFSDEAARRIWRIAPELAGDDCLGLHLAATSTMEDLGVLGYLARASATLGEACARAVRFEQLLKGGTDVDVVLDSGGARLVDTPAKGQEAWPRQLAETIMALWWIWPQRWAAVPCRPVVVRFQHKRPRNSKSLDELTRIFDCPIEFEKPCNELVIDAAVWSLPLPSADPLLSRYLEPVVESELARLAVEDPLLQRVRGRILEMMPSGTFDVTRVARAVGLSRRTLHRRLRERGLTYQDLVDDLRRQAALRLLEARQHTLMEVAFLVGFSDPSSLRRACQRWTRAGRFPRATALV